MQMDTWYQALYVLSDLSSCLIPELEPITTKALIEWRELGIDLIRVYRKTRIFKLVENEESENETLAIYRFAALDTINPLTTSSPQIPQTARYVVSSSRLAHIQIP